MRYHWIMIPPRVRGLTPLLRMEIKEPDLVTRTRAKLDREQLIRDYIASLLQNTLIEQPEQGFTDLMHNVWLQDPDLEQYEVVSVLYGSLSNRWVRIDHQSVCTLLVPTAVMAMTTLWERPATGAIKMTMLYMLAAHPDGLRPEDLLQKAYDREHEDFGVRVAAWELLVSGEITVDTAGYYHLAGK
jgi:hypothetical protein